MHLNLAGSLRRAGMGHLAALDTLVTEIGNMLLAEMWPRDLKPRR